MTDWNEIAEDHYIALSHSGDLYVDDDGYPLAPPSSRSADAGLDPFFVIQSEASK